jgi:tetratricopeptide (TPR) repeat protein
MAVCHRSALITAALLLALPLCGQQQQQSQSGQQPQSGQQSTTSTQDLPSAPLPQPTAGQKKEDTRKPSVAPPPSPPAEPGPYGPTGPSSTAEPPRAAPPEVPGSSTSKDDKVDISPPANDTRAHPNADLDNPDIGEFHPFDPHRAAKDIEVGDFYYKRQNYHAAVSRYREALLYKPNDAVATFSLADALEKVGDVQEAAKNYQAYLKILPYGPRAKDAHKALQRLKAKTPAPRKPTDTAKIAQPKH